MIKEKRKLTYKNEEEILQLSGNLVGNIMYNGKIRLSGELRGSISAQEIIVDSSSTLIGNLKAEKATIFGTVLGDIEITNELCLQETACVNGKIESKHLIDLYKPSIIY